MELDSPDQTVSTESIDTNAVDQLKAVPSAVQAEQWLLGSLIIDNHRWDDIVDKVSIDDFYHASHQVIFSSIQKLLSASQPVDVVTLSEFIDNQGQLDAIGGYGYLAQLSNNTPSALNIKAYATIIREKAVLRGLLDAATDIADKAYFPEGRSSNELLDYAERIIFNLGESRTTSTGPKTIKPLLNLAINRIDELYNAKGALTGVPTGFDDLDEITSGLQASDLVIIAGRPSMGKTSFAMNLCENAAIKSELPVLVFSMEMPADALVLRMLSSLGRIDQSNIRSGKIKDDDWPRLNSAISILSSKQIYIDDTPALTPSEVRSRARRVFRENNKLGLILIDYLQLMQVPGSESRVSEISEISRSLKALAKELNTPVLALSQLNRGLEQRPNKRPIMSDLRESGAIEQDADLITFIYRDEVYNEDSPEKGVAEIIIGKHRNGPIGTVKLAFLGQYTKFENLAYGYE